MSLAVADATGEPVASIRGLRARPADLAQLQAPSRSETKHLYRVEFQPVELPSNDQASLETYVVSPTRTLAAQLGVPHFEDLDALLAQLPASDGPLRVLVDATTRVALSELPVELGRMLSVGTCVSESRLERSEIVVVTSAAVGCGAAGAWEGLLFTRRCGVWSVAARSEQAERALRPGAAIWARGARRRLVHRRARATAEPELALRGGVALAARLCVARDQATGGSQQPALSLPEGEGGWTLSLAERGRLDSLTLERRAPRALGEGEVRVEVRAAGLNFRDVLNALDMVQAPELGFECAGVVREVGSAVRGLAVGDPVMGLALGAFSDEVTTDARFMVKQPMGLSFEEAATVPLAYATALYALEDLGGFAW